jgi:tyrosine-protein phosphatase SIW14
MCTAALGRDFRYAPRAVANRIAERSIVVHNGRINCRVTVVAGFLAVVSLIAGTQVSRCQAQQKLRGLPNFGRVTESLYRGGQPTSDGLNELRAMGVEMVVNFRENRTETEKEKRKVESLGMKYTGIPWSANHDPSSVQIVEFLDLIRANPHTKIFVHCRRGADRTGVMIASYRIAVEHKSVAEAVSEMRQFHYDWFFRPHLKRYIEALPDLLQTNPQFAAYRPQPSATR